MEYEAVIGLEVHVQLKTRTKMFTRVEQGFGHEPNTLTNPVIMGLPGVLPVLNLAAIEQSVRMGLVFGAEVPEVCRWDRKNYFYPDSPKNYQLTQLHEPIVVGGEVEIELPGPSRNVMGEHKHIRLDHAHLEEDVGKLNHYDFDSLVDYNRAGTPLLEIVTQPDLRSPEEAVALLQSLRMHLVAAGISDCDMEKGQMRCDANVSVRPQGADYLNKRCEMKNLNSISGVRNAIAYEIRRQAKVYEKGGTVIQETRRWDAESGVTTSMRSKEEAHDYRYFPDPDLMPVRLPRERVEALRAELPEGVFDQQRRYMEQYDFPYTLTSVICYDFELSRFFELAHAEYDQNPKAIANYIANELQRERAAGEEDGLLPMSQLLITPSHIAELVRIIDEGKLTKHLAKDVFTEMFQTGKRPAAIVKEKGLEQEDNSDELEGILKEAIAKNQKAADDVRAGNEKAINAFVGPAMKATKGKANPQQVREIVLKLLNG
ncbi:MAG: aspartyl-tRNA(Asn)/glutamyl-tRNA (Gln) amidotransferase subunit B [Puniceicoccaceae bacterium 5H]|nr:MAG: aspartyl-tRNA(Asn)/glutamyl-tRNA (Gln) amidotransferase subunit B [Puniceicoccaceae bacterium 5H]